MTLRSPIFRKLLLSSFLLIIGTVVVLDYFLTRYTASREVRTVEQLLASQARILAGDLPSVREEDLQDWARRAAGRAESRITVIERGGKVLADSQHDPETMENHAGRPEVRAALEGRLGTSIRHSATLDRDLLYLALPATGGGRPPSGLILRVAVPLQEVAESIAEVRWSILRASLLAALLALVAAYFFSRSFTRRIRQVQSFAEGLVNARFPESLPPGPEDELGALSKSLTNVAGQLRDMVQRLSLEGARREAILSSMVEGVLAVDHELCVTFCNKAFARAVGADWPVPERLPVLELVRDPAFLNMLTSTLVKGELLRERIQLAAAAGRLFEVQAAPLEAPSRRGAIALLHDVTDVERLERVRSDFVANVSHELRTPLAAIQGYAETLLNGALEDSENNRRFVEIIRSHAIRLNSIASDLLVLSELESGQPAPSSEEISVLEVVQAAMCSVGSEAKVRNVAIHCGDLSDCRIAGHRIRLEQALVNLLDNAVKFNRLGGEVWIRTGQSPEKEMRIEVEDNGIGIPSDDLPRIFERFYRVDKARSRDVGGTGLGLSIVKHAVERMGGKVAVESRLGKGTKFSLIFPNL